MFDIHLESGANPQASAQARNSLIQPMYILTG